MSIDYDALEASGALGGGDTSRPFFSFQTATPGSAYTFTVDEIRSQHFEGDKYPSLLIDVTDTAGAEWTINCPGALRKWVKANLRDINPGDTLTITYQGKDGNAYMIDTAFGAPAPAPAPLASVPPAATPPSGPPQAPLSTPPAA